MIPLLLLTLLAADPLPGILAKMDASSVNFKGVKANIKRINYTAIVEKSMEHTGTMVLKRTAPHDVRTLINFTGEQQVYIGEGVADIYYPKRKVVEERKIGKYQTLFEQYYLLAFGGSGKDLVANYDVTYVGEDPLGAHLQLIPKSPDVKKSYTEIELWLNAATAVPSQLRLTTPSKDTITFVYTNVVMNPKISDGDLKLHTESGVKKEYPVQ